MKPLAIGVGCFPTFGGSGIVATEVGLAMARRGHRVHFVCTDRPCRLEDVENVAFHPVNVPKFPALAHLPRSLALASTMARVAKEEGLDILHTHYAMPHAVCAAIARDMVGGRLKVVTTLHGTDITLVGADPAYRDIVRHAIVRSDAVTTPSAFLRAEAVRCLELDQVPIDVVPNFVDADVWHPLAPSGGRPLLEALFGPDAAAVPTVAHVSNFRPIKRVDRVIDVFARVAAERPAFLLLVGEGPERAEAEAELRRRNLLHRARLTGNRSDVAQLLRESAVFLLPSETESFGLAALEALASGVPVVASAVGGLPEVVRHGETGSLLPPDDTDGMAASIGALLDDPGRRATVAAAARADAMERFRPGPLVSRYESLYARVLAHC